MSKTKTPYNKDTAFKAVVVLVLIGVVLGGLLALLNDLLYVSTEEITMRIIKKFYDGEEKAYTVVDEERAPIVQVAPVQQPIMRPAPMRAPMMAPATSCGCNNTIGACQVNPGVKGPIEITIPAQKVCIQ